MPNIHENLKIIRTLRNITVKQAAGYLSISPQAYRKIESVQTRISAKHLQILSEKFRVSIEQIRQFDVDDWYPPPVIGFTNSVSYFEY
jgi:transcriptional regulator with XRE-family HTH domain